MKKRIFVVIILIIIFTTITVLLSFSSKSNDTELGSDMAIMVQNENNNTQYDEWNNETWPDENQYQLNTTKSNCNNTENVTNILSYSNNNILLTTNKIYRCNLYFDKKSQEPLTIVSVDVDNTSEYYTVKLTVNATGGSGNYTYDVENTCTYCSQNLNKCWRDSSNVVISTNKNVITISNLQATNYEHNFIIKVKDGKSEASYTVQNVEVESEPCPHGQSCPVSQCEVI